MLENNFIRIDPSEIKIEETYKLLIGSILPRPIALVSSMNKNGESNLAPFSFFNGVSSKPPCIMVSIARKSNGDKKDTLLNIEETEEFVINSANKWLIEELVHCAASYPYGVSEMEKAGLTSLPSEVVKPFRVKESAFQMECKLYNKMEIGDGSAGSSTIIVGEIVCFHINNAIYNDGKILLDKYQPVARLAGSNYCSVGEQINIQIPKI